MTCTVKDSNFKRLNEIYRSAFYRRVRWLPTNPIVGNDLRVVPLSKILGYPKYFGKCDTFSLLVTVPDNYFFDNLASAMPTFV